MNRTRLRNLGIAIGKYPTGIHNAISDVPGVRVGHTTLITGTHYVGIAHQALVEYSAKNGFAETWSLPVVAETYDGFLNDCNTFHLKPQHVFEAIANASRACADTGLG